jgi:hypothetical protein
MFTMNDEFLTRVSFAGVPHTLSHSDDVSQATIYPISAGDVCKLYWLLSSLNLSYTYSKNGVNIARNFSAASTITPKDRMITPATFFTTAYDAPTQASYTLDLSFEEIYFDSTDNAKLGIKLTIEETDTYNFIDLCLNQVQGMENISRSFTFMGRSFQAYLNYDAAHISSASFSSFSITPQFFTI